MFQMLNLQKNLVRPTIVTGLSAVALNMHRRQRDATLTQANRPARNNSVSSGTRNLNSVGQYICIVERSVTALGRRMSLGHRITTRFRE